MSNLSQNALGKKTRDAKFLYIFWFWSRKAIKSIQFSLNKIIWRSDMNKSVVTLSSHCILQSISKQQQSAVQRLIRHASQRGDSVDLPSSHRRECPLTQSNEIILGEVMLKMNHLLAIPKRHSGYISPEPCTLRPSILHHHGGLRLHSSKTQRTVIRPHRRQHLAGSSRLIQSQPNRSNPASAYL